MKFGWASGVSPANQEICICVSPESPIWICQVGFELSLQLSQEIQLLSEFLQR